MKMHAWIEMNLDERNTKKKKKNYKVRRLYGRWGAEGGACSVLRYSNGECINKEKDIKGGSIERSSSKIWQYSNSNLIRKSRFTIDRSIDLRSYVFGVSIERDRRELKEPNEIFKEKQRIGWMYFWKKLSFKYPQQSRTKNHRISIVNVSTK